MLKLPPGSKTFTKRFALSIPGAFSSSFKIRLYSCFTFCICFSVKNCFVCVVYFDVGSSKLYPSNFGKAFFLYTETHQFWLLNFWQWRQKANVQKAALYWMHFCQHCIRSKIKINFQTVWHYRFYSNSFFKSCAAYFYRSEPVTCW